MVQSTKSKAFKPGRSGWKLIGKTLIKRLSTDEDRVWVDLEISQVSKGEGDDAEIIDLVTVSRVVDVKGQGERRTWVALTRDRWLSVLPALKAECEKGREEPW